MFGKSAEVFAFVEQVRNVSVFALADIQPVFLADMADQTAFLTRCKEAFGDKIVAIHVKDFRFDENGRKMEAGLFKGDFDWDAFLRVFKGYEFPMLRDEGAQFENKVEFDELRRRIAQN